MALTKNNPTTTHSWQKLIQHFADNEHVELKELFKNSSRKEDFSIAVEEKFKGVEGRLEGVEGRLTKIESTMVTKDYLDDKMADLRGDLVCLVKKEDKKVDAVVETLKTKNIISKAESKNISSLGPFTRTA